MFDNINIYTCHTILLFFCMILYCHFQNEATWLGRLGIQFFSFFSLDSVIFSCIMFWYDNAFQPLNASFEYMRTLFSSASLFLLRIWDILVEYRIWTKLETFEFLDPGIGIPRQQELRIEAVGDGEGHAPSCNPKCAAWFY